MLTHTYANFQQLTKKLFEKETITLTPEKKNGVKSTEKKKLRNHLCIISGSITLGAKV